MQQTSSSSYKYSATSATGGAPIVSRQASGMVRDQSSAGEVVRAANFAYLQPTTASYQTTSYSTQQPATTSYQGYNATTTYGNQAATAYNASAATGTSYAAQGAAQGTYTTGSAYTTPPLTSAAYNTQGLTGASYATRAVGVHGGASSSSVTYGGGHGGDFTSASRMMTGGERVTATRKVSSTIIDEQYVGPAPQDLPTREVVVEGPVEDQVKYVPKKEIVESEKRVPRYEIEWVEKIVEVPRIEYVDRTVEVPVYVDVNREVKVPQWVDQPREVIKEVKVPRINYVEKIEEVPGPVVEVPKPYLVEQKVDVTRYTDKQHPVVVAQTIKPYIVEGSGVYEVDVFEYEPQCIPVDVHVLKAVQAQLNGQMMESSHRVVTVPVAQYNTMLQQLNSHLSQAELQKLPYLTENGQVTFLGERISYIEPQPSTYIEGLDMTKMTQTHEVRGQVTSSQQTTTTTMTTTGTGNLVMPSPYAQSYQVSGAYGSTGGGSAYQTGGTGYQASSGAGYQGTSGAYMGSGGQYQAEYSSASYSTSGAGGRTGYAMMSTGNVRPSVSGSSVKYASGVVGN